MPIIIFKDGSTGISTPIFVSPDREGRFSVFPGRELYDIPENLDPLKELGVKVLLNGNLPEEDAPRNMEVDYKGINVRNREQMLSVNDGVTYSKKFYLSPSGKGGALGKNLTQNMAPHQFELFSFSPIRIVEEGYRRKREGDRCFTEVLGWETNDEFFNRKPKMERRV